MKWPASCIHYYFTCLSEPLLRSLQTWTPQWKSIRLRLTFRATSTAIFAHAKMLVLCNTQSSMSPNCLLFCALHSSACVCPPCQRRKKNTKWQRLNTGLGGTFLCTPNHDTKSWNLKVTFTGLPSRWVHMRCLLFQICIYHATVKTSLLSIIYLCNETKISLLILLWYGRSFSLIICSFLP